MVGLFRNTFPPIKRPAKMVKDTDTNG